MITDEMKAFEEFYCKTNNSPALNNTYRANRLRFDMFLYRNDAMRIDRVHVVGLMWISLALVSVFLVNL